jgi:hypothetical protein
MRHGLQMLIFFFTIETGVMQATTEEQFEQRYSPNFKLDESLRRQSSTKRKRDGVLRYVLSTLHTREIK